jgi:hypothetical protein
MKTERLLLRFSDGTGEWQTPATAPDVGSIIRRAGGPSPPSTGHRGYDRRRAPSSA